MNPTDTYKRFNLTTEYTFFSSTHRIFLVVDQMTGHKIGLTIFRRVQPYYVTTVLVFSCAVVSDPL